MAPEAPEHRVVVGPEQAVVLREQHPGAGIEGIIDAPRSLHGEALRIGVAACVHIGVAHLAPEMRRALLLRSHEFRATQRVGAPFKFGAVFFLKLEKPPVGDERVGALVVGVNTYARLIHDVSLFGRMIIPDPNKAWNRAMRLLMLQKRMGPGA